MVRMKLDRTEFDPDDLDVEWEEGQTFTKYDGDIPPVDTVLIARITKMWWTQTNDGSASMIKMVAVAEQNTGDLEEYNGLDSWENLTFKKTAAFRYGPFLAHFGIAYKDIFNKMDVEEEDDRIGTPINKIGNWVVGSDDALCRIVTGRDKYKGKQQSRIEGWLDYEEPDDEDDEDEPAPRRGSGTRSSNGRTATASRRAAAAPASRRRRAEPEPEPDEDDEYYDDDEPDDEPEPETRSRARNGSRTRSAARSSSGGTRTRGSSPRSSTARTSTRASSRTRAAEPEDDEAGYDDEPPF